jgi:hypothetical protein
VRGLIGEHAGPAALAAVDSAVVEVAAHTRLEHRLGDLHPKQVVLGRLEGAEVFGEDREGAFDRHVDDDRRAYGPRCCVSAHEPSFVGCSTTSL